MMLAALLFLLAGAVAGTFLAVRHFLRRRLPVWVAVLHGLGGATGFTLVLLGVVREPNFVPARQALYLLIATVALGCVNLLFHVRRVRHRTSLIVMHALTALSAAGTLLYAIVVHEPAAADPAPSPPAAPSDTPAAPVASVAPVPPAEATETAKPASAPATPEPAPAASAASARVGGYAIDPSVQEILSRPVRFGTNGANVLSESASALAEMARVLKEHPEVELVEIQGHADARGDDAHNLGLTRTRASAVLETLVALGVARSRLRLAAYGARCPADEACGGEGSPARCTSQESWDHDRRVVLVPLRVGSVSFKGPLVCVRGAELIPPEDREFHAP